MRARNITEIRSREDLLGGKPGDVSDEAWLEELQGFFNQQIEESLSAYGDKLGEEGSERRKQRQASMERVCLAGAQMRQAEKRGLLKKLAIFPDGTALEILTEESPQPIKTTGLPATYRASVPFERGRISGELVSLSAGQEAALRAVIILLEKYNYEGDQGSSPTDSEYEYFYSGKLPKVSFSPAEYYEARGLPRDKEGQFRGKAAEDVKQDLKDLNTTFEFGPYLFDLGGGVSRTVKGSGPLMNVWMIEVTDTEEASGNILRQEERFTVEPRPELIRYSSRFGIRPHPLILAGLGLDGGRENFVRIEVDIQSRIKALYAGRRYPHQSVEHLASYLHEIDLEPFTIGKDKLAQRIGLESALKQGRRKRVTKYIEEAIQVALSLGIITSYEDSGDQYIFHLSKEKGRRKAKTERQKSLPLKKKAKKR